MCAFLSADPMVDAERFKHEIKKLDDDLLQTCFETEQFVKSFEAARQFENMCNIVRKSGRSPFVYQSSHDERTIARCEPYQKPAQVNTFERKANDFIKSIQKCLTSFRPSPREISLSGLGLMEESVNDPETQPEDSEDDTFTDAEVHEKPARSSLAWYWNEDKRRGQEHVQPVLPCHVIVMNMVDPYVDWTKIAVQLPILFRTLRITQVCGRDSHKSFLFTSENILEYTTLSTTDSISGERRLKTFKHGVWIFENGREVSFGGFSYRVHVRDPNPDSDYRFVLLMPIARIPQTFEELTLGFFGVNPRYIHHSSYPGCGACLCRSLCLRLCGQTERFSISADPREPAFFLPLDLRKFYTFKKWFGEIPFLCGAGHYRPIVEPAPPIRRLQTAIRGDKNSWSVLVVQKVGATPVTNPTYRELVNHDFDRDEPLDIDETLLVQIALAGDYSYVTISHSMYRQMLSRSRITAADAVEQFQWKVPRDRAFLLDFIKDTKGNVDLDDVPFVLLYEASNKRYDTIKIKGVQPLMRPLGVVTPHGPVTNSGSNESRGVNRRIGGVMAGPRETQLTVSIVDHGNEFVGLLKDHLFYHTGRNTFHPKPYEEVIEHQTTAYKKQTVETSLCANDSRPLKKSNQAFVKNEVDGGESAGKIKAEPRIISTKEGDKVKAEYLSYMYSLKELLLLLPCCAVGRSVRWVEEGIKRLAQTGAPSKLFEASILPHHTSKTNVEHTPLKTFEGDLSRQDGRKDCPWRAIFDKILSEFFKGSERDKVRAMHASTIAMKMRTKTGGGKYNTGYTMGSGMPDTTLNNTLENMFISYHGLRKKGYSKEDAWANLLGSFLFAGDDSVGKDLNRTDFMEACSDMHHLGKYLVVDNDSPLGFLGRKFGPNLRVLRSVVMSIHDPTRSLIKFTCCTATLPNQEERRKRLHDKACAINVTDKHSFAISTVANCIIRAAEKEYKWKSYDNFDLNYNLQAKDEFTGENSSYTQEPNDWSEQLYRKAWPAVDFESMVEYFSADRTFAEIEEHPIFGQAVPCQIDSGLTVLQRPLDHSQPTEIVRHGTLEQEKIEVNDEKGKPTNPNPKKQGEYKKAFHSAVKEMDGVEHRDKKTIIFSDAAIEAGKSRSRPRSKRSGIPVSEEETRQRAQNRPVVQMPCIEIARMLDPLNFPVPKVEPSSSSSSINSDSSSSSSELPRPPPEVEPSGSSSSNSSSSSRRPPRSQRRPPGKGPREAKSGITPRSSAKGAVTSTPVVGQSTEKVARTPRPAGDSRRGKLRGESGPRRPRK